MRDLEQGRARELATWLEEAPPRKRIKKEGTEMIPPPPPHVAAPPLSLAPPLAEQRNMAPLAAAPLQK